MASSVLEWLCSLPKHVADAVLTCGVSDPLFAPLDEPCNRLCLSLDPLFWQAVRRVMKPGAHAAVIATDATYHRIACAIEDAGLEIRDSVHCFFASTKETTTHCPEASCEVRHYPVVLARSPLAEPTVARNVLLNGVGAKNIDGCRIPTTERITDHSAEAAKSKGKIRVQWTTDGTSTSGQRLGRFPANIMFDSDTAALLDLQSGITASVRRINNNLSVGKGATYYQTKRHGTEYTDVGGASRFFKVFQDSRNARSSPSVISYLTKLILPINKRRPGQLGLFCSSLTIKCTAGHGA